MRARDLFERVTAGPTEAPPTKPDVKPAPPVERPGRPPAPGKHPNPFRRRHPGKEPGPMPKPKACVEAKALFTKVPPKKFPAVPPKRFNRESAIKLGRAKTLPDDKTVLKGAIKKGQNATKSVLTRSVKESAKNIIRTLR